MDILGETLNRILSNVPNTPPEVGGILGSVDGIICQYQSDTGIPTGCGCFYSPNVIFLNNAINNWQREGILFQGIFHTHYFGVETLSPGDISYIETILKAMPPYIKELFFPVVVMPDRKIIPYLASFTDGVVTIKKDVLRIV